MLSFILKKLNIISVFFIIVFAVGYILFSSLSTSLDFKINQITTRQSEINEEYEQALAFLGQAQGKDYLSVASARMNLVDIDLTAGYLDINSAAAQSSETLAKNIRN